MIRFYTLIAISLVLISWVHPTAAQDTSTWMPDKKLRTAVRASLGLADNEELAQAKMLDPTALHAPQEEMCNPTRLEFKHR